MSKPEGTEGDVFGRVRRIDQSENNVKIVITAPNPLSAVLLLNQLHPGRSKLV